MTSATAHSLSDNSEADKQQNYTVSEIEHSSPANGMSHPGYYYPAMQYSESNQLGGVGNVMAQTGIPYPDPYYRSIFAPYDTQSYPAHPYPAQPAFMGIQQAGVPLPCDAVDEPVFVNAKQYHGILRRRESRAKAEAELKLAKSRKRYLHESRHLHAVRRARGMGGRFQKKIENHQKDAESSEKSQGHINLNSEKDYPDSSESAS